MPPSLSSSAGNEQASRFLFSHRAAVGRIVLPPTLIRSLHETIALLPLRHGLLIGFVT